MKFNVFITIKGVGGAVDAPAVGNPIDATDLEELLRKLADSLPDYSRLGAATTGIRVEEVT